MRVITDNTKEDAVEEEIAEATCTVSTFDFMRACSCAVNATAKSDTRYSLALVRVKVVEGQVTVTATNGTMAVAHTLKAISYTGNLEFGLTRIDVKVMIAKHKGYSKAIVKLTDTGVVDLVDASRLSNTYTFPDVGDIFDSVEPNVGYRLGEGVIDRLSDMSVSANLLALMVKALVPSQCGDTIKIRLTDKRKRPYLFYVGDCKVQAKGLLMPTNKEIK